MLLMFLLQKSRIFLRSCRVAELWQLVDCRGVPCVFLLSQGRKKESPTGLDIVVFPTFCIRKRLAACSVEDLPHLQETNSCHSLPSSPKRAALPPREN